MRVYLLSLVLVLFLLGCEKPEELIAPYHFSIVPKPENLTITKVDSTTTAGKLYVHLSWTLSDASGLKNFEVHRSDKFPNNFRIVPQPTTKFNFVDSTIGTFTRPINFYYKVYSYGFKTDPKTGLKTTFQGPESDIYILELKK